MTRALLALFALAGCGSNDVAIEPVEFLDYALFVPEDWKSRDLSLRNKPLVEWAPSENDRKETLAISRVDRAAVAKGGPNQIAGLLLAAQRSLPESRFSSPRTFATRSGMVGVRIEGDFVPSGQPHRYRRMHATLIDGTSLIHVSYTARDADPQAFEVAVNTLARKGA